MRQYAARVLLPLAFFLSTLGWIVVSGRLNGDYRIDEAHKVADTFMLKLLLEGDLTNPEWFRDVYDRTHPPVAKYVYGLAMLLRGLDLPSTQTIRLVLPDGRLGQSLQPQYVEQYRPHLRAARWVSAIATALTVAIVCWLGARLHSALAGIMAAIFYLAHYLTATFAATAVHDPLLTLFVTATAWPVFSLWNRPSRSGRVLAVLSAAVLAALAMQTRLSGGVSLVAAVVVLAGRGLWTRKREYIVDAILIATVSFAMATAIYPYYWVVPRDSADVSPVFHDRSVAPVRIVHRYAIQVHESQQLLAQEGTPLGTTRERLAFSAQVLLGDLIALVAVLGNAVAALFLHPRAGSRRPLLAFVTSWSVVIAAITVLWIPVPWPRYLLVAVPAIALPGAVGWSELIFQMAAAAHMSFTRKQRLSVQ